MKQEVRQHLLPLFILFIIIATTWAITFVPFYQFIYLFFGFLWGAFFLDIDHLIYWLYLKPQLPESQQATLFLKNKDLSSLLTLLENRHKHHTSLVFHHYFFQTALALVSFFIISSSANVFSSAFVIALNIHLLVDEFYDYHSNPRHLQQWLFAREQKQLPLSYLKHYLLFFTLLTLVFIIILISFF